MPFTIDTFRRFAVEIDARPLLEEVTLRIAQCLSGEIATIDELETSVAPLAEGFGGYRLVTTALSTL